MRAQRISRGVLGLVFLITAATSLIRNEVFQGTTTVINWDGYGYYAYLPGAFVYGDVSTYAFAEEHLQRYDVSSDLYQLMETEQGRRFPIYNVGLAVVWAPAFLLTHAFVAATGVAPADGMSYPYQLMVVLMGLLFAFGGLWFLRRFLALFYPDLVVGLVLLVLGLGTNLFYYTVEAPDMTHSYLFTLYACFLFCFARGVAPAKHTGGEEFSEKKWLVYCGLIAGLLCLIRSSEIVVFAIPAFYGLRNWATLQRNFWRTLPIFGLALAVFSLQLIYYKIGTGQWWQNGYAGLGFDWRSPHLYEGFLGYRRGWLVYTPLLALGLAGIAWLKKPWFLPILLFTLANCYLLFSWHIWWYGDTFGSRPVVQSYAVLALPLGALLAWLVGADAGAGKKNTGAGLISQRRTGLVCLVLAPFILLNLFQHWQYNQRILPLDFVNRTYYWHVFGKTQLDKKDRVFLDTNEKLPNRAYATTPLRQRDTLIAVPPKTGREFTNLLERTLTAPQVTDGLWLQASLSYAYFGDSFDKWKFPGIVTEHRRDGEVLKWVQVNIPRTMSNPAKDSLTFHISLPGAREGDVVKQYLWNLSQDSMQVQAYRSALLSPTRQ